MNTNLSSNLKGVSFKYKSISCVKTYPEFPKESNSIHTLTTKQREIEENLSYHREIIPLNVDNNTSFLNADKSSNVSLLDQDNYCVNCKECHFDLYKKCVKWEYGQTFCANKKNAFIMHLNIQGGLVKKTA